MILQIYHFGFQSFFIQIIIGKFEGKFIGVFIIQNNWIYFSYLEYIF